MHIYTHNIEKGFGIGSSVIALKSYRQRVITRIALACSFASCIVISATSSAELSVIAVAGESAANTTSTFEAFDVPVINSAGETAFTTNISSGESILYRATEDHFDTISRSDQVMSGLSEMIFTGTEPAINSRGQVAFKGFAQNSNDAGIYRGDGTTVTEIARTGQMAGSFPNDVYGEDFSLPLINDEGDVAYRAALNDEGDPKAIYRYADGQTLRVARMGSGTPLDMLSAPTGMTDNGQVAFRAHRPNDNWDSLYKSSGQYLSLGDPLFPHGVAVTTPGAQIVEVRPGDISDPLVANTGRVAFNSQTADVDEPDFPTGALDVNAGGTLQVLALAQGFGTSEGSPFGPVWNQIGVAAINDQAQTLYRGSIRGAAETSFQGTSDFAGGLILHGSDQGWRVLIETSKPLDVFGFGRPQIEGLALSNGGHIAFSAEDGPSDSAIFMVDTLIGSENADKDVIYQVARQGDHLLGSTITDLVFVKQSSTSRGLRASPAAAVTERSGINERGQVAFWFELEDGRSGIAVWDPPRMEQVVDGGFDLGLLRWNTEGDGSAIAIDPDEAGKGIELSPGSPITLSQVLDTPDQTFDVSFDYRFITEDGSLHILLDGKTIAALNGADIGSMDDYETKRLRLVNMTGLENTRLAFTFDGPAQSRIQLDNVSLRAIPEPASLALLALAAGGVIGLKRSKQQRI